MRRDKNNAHQSSTPKHGSRRRFMLLRNQEQCPPDTVRVGMDAIQSSYPAVIRDSVSAVAKILHHRANSCIFIPGMGFDEEEGPLGPCDALTMWQH
jgi:hypothetical protein